MRLSSRFRKRTRSTIFEAAKLGSSKADEAANREVAIDAINELRFEQRTRASCEEGPQEQLLVLVAKQNVFTFLPWEP